MSARGTSPVERDVGRRGLNRLEAFSDGVFAIAITLLVLQFDVPPLDTPDTELAEELLGQFPQFLSFALSFLVIGRYWVAHHSTFAYIRRYDGTFLFLNLVLLFGVAFLPYPTEVLGEHGDQGTAVVLYAASISAVSVASSAIWWYATRRHRLVDPDLDPAFIRSVQLRAASGAAVFLVSIPLAFVSVYASYAVWAVFFPLVRVGIRRRERRRTLRSDEPGREG
ncbi:MAG TPA: TMEM175 family protein [Actinomycetota bacterium]|nr:TMEM175 family protein [Actinomycetota bacterium]